MNSKLMFVPLTIPWLVAREETITLSTDDLTMEGMIGFACDSRSVLMDKDDFILGVYLESPSNTRVTFKIIRAGHADRIMI